MLMKAQSIDRLWHHRGVRGHLLHEVFKIHPLAVEDAREFLWFWRRGWMGRGS
jgi:hypothetical protein